MHIESHAWTTNTKQKMACGSVFVSHRLEYYEWFTRALKPGIHFVEVDPDTICVDTATKVSFAHTTSSRLAIDYRGTGLTTVSIMGTQTSSCHVVFSCSVIVMQCCNVVGSHL